MVAKPAADNLKKIAAIANNYQVVNYKQSENGDNIVVLKKGTERATITWSNKPSQAESGVMNKLKSFSLSQQPTKVTPLLIQGNTPINADSSTPVLKMSNQP
ncbi:hypothetical protein D3C86_1731140 [compost metagenome]